MTQGSERRKYHRFQVPDGEARHRKAGLLGRLKGLSEPYPVVNMSKGGLAFLCDVPFRENTELEIQLLVPGKSPLALLGKTRWQGPAEGRQDGTVIVGIHFRPFGDKRGCNPHETLDVLRKLQKEYGGQATT